MGSAPAWGAAVSLWGLKSVFGDCSQTLGTAVKFWVLQSVFGCFHPLPVPEQSMDLEPVSQE